MAYPHFNLQVSRSRWAHSSHLHSEKELAKIQKKNGDELSEAVAKRDAFAEAAADLVEELANLDDD